MPCLIITSASKNNSVAVTIGSSSLTSSYNHQQNGGQNCLICGSIVHMTRVSAFYSNYYEISY